MDELFAKLQQAASAAERQEIVCQALSSGVDQNEVREMLDYLETSGSQGHATAREISSPNRERVRTQHKGSWAAYLCGLIYR